MFGYPLYLKSTVYSSIYTLHLSQPLINDLYAEKLLNCFYIIWWPVCTASFFILLLINAYSFFFLKSFLVLNCYAVPFLIENMYTVLAQDSGFIEPRVYF